jgi:hypothetical protein
MYKIENNPYLIYRSPFSFRIYKMSLVPYNTSENIDYAPFMIGAAFAATALLMNTLSDKETSDIEIKPLEEKENVPLSKGKIPAGDHALDSHILQILSTVNKPLTVKELVKIIASNDTSISKSDVNSRLYTLLSKKMINKKETNKAAPAWCSL